MEKTYKIILIAVIALFTSVSGFSQNMIQGEPSQELKQQASETANLWARELAMSPKQTELMEDKLIEFAKKKDEAIQSDLPKEEKTQVILELQERQISDMRDILTQVQYRKYLQLSEEAKIKQDRDEDW